MVIGSFLLKCSSVSQSQTGSYLLRCHAHFEIQLPSIRTTTIPSCPASISTNQPMRARHLDLETPRASPATSSLELPPLALDVRFLPSVWPKTKVLHCLSSILWSPQQQRITPCRSSQSQLIQRKTLATRLFDPSSSRSGEAKGGDGDFGDGEEAVIVCDGTHNNDGLACVLFGCRIMLR